MHPLGLHQPLEDLRLPIHRMGVDKRHHRFHDFANRLMELDFPGVLGDDVVHELRDACGRTAGGIGPK